jgi:acetoin utilization protein AcuB
MTQKHVPIERYMTSSPHSIGQEQSLAVAHDLMRKYEIRHLPVLHGGKLVGLVSLRDLHLVETLPDVDPAQVLVEDAMTEDVYSVAPTDDLADVAEDMAHRKLGSAVVLRDTKVVGVFTTTDALRALAEQLKDGQR